MRYLLQGLRILLLFLLISGCVFQQVYIDRAVVRNQTGGIISEVRIQHKPTDDMGEVESILPYNSFELGFPKQKMHADKAMVSWTDKNGKVNNAEIILPRSAPGTILEESSTLVYTIYPEGRVTAEIKE